MKARNLITVYCFSNTNKENKSFIFLFLLKDTENHPDNLNQKLSKALIFQISYHNFKKTPSKEELSSIVEKSLSIGDIAKFATMINSKSDILNVLSTINKYSGKVIGIGMGEKGKITRILGPYFGSILTFASYKGKSSAPGQIDINTLKEIWRLMDLY